MGVHPSFLRFDAALVLYPPVILAFTSMGAAAVISSILTAKKAFMDWTTGKQNRRTIQFGTHVPRLFLFLLLIDTSGARRSLHRMDDSLPHPPCPRCSEAPRFIASTLEAHAGRRYYMFECRCGERLWTSEKAKLEDLE